MARIVEDRWGEQLFLQGSDCDLSVDRRADRLTFTRHFVIGKSREQTIQLDRLEGLTIMADGLPAMSTRLVGKLLRGVLNAHKEGPPDLGELTSELPMEIGLRLLEQGDSSSAKPNEVRFSVETLRDRQRLVEFAFKLAAAAGLHYGTVFAIPNAGLQIRLRSRQGPNLGRLPGPSGEAEDSGLGDAASEALAAAKVPSFEPSTSHCDHKVLEWSPGKRVVFRRPFRWAAPFIFPFTLLVFTGPGIYVFSKLNSEPMDLAVTSFLTLFGSVIGGIAIVGVVMLLPRETEIDWMSRQIAARTWFRSRKLRFDELQRLELVAKRSQRSGGESGSGSVSFACNLRAVSRTGTGKGPRELALVSTASFQRSGEPFWEGVPLLFDLAAAIRVEGRIVDYEFRQAK